MSFTSIYYSLGIVVCTFFTIPLFLGDDATVFEWIVYFFCFMAFLVIAGLCVLLMKKSNVYKSNSENNDR